MPRAKQGGASRLSSSKDDVAPRSSPDHPGWGFAFTPPAGWKVAHDYTGAVLGHDRVAGMILVIPHQASSTAEVQAEMQRGLTEEGTYLMPAGPIGAQSGNVLAGEYAGSVQGQQAWARGSKEAGVLVLTMDTGERREVAYRVESPGRYRRYLFDGVAYFRK